MNTHNHPSESHPPDAQFPHLEAAGRAAPFEVPAGYFDGLAGRMMGGIRAAEQEEDYDAATLPAKPESQAQQLPETYFENLPGHVLRRLDRQPAKSARKMALLRPLRYAAAALLLLTAGIGTWQALKPGPADQPQTAAAAMADVSAEDIEAFSEETGELGIDANANANAPVPVAGPIAALSPDDIVAWEDATGEQVSGTADIP